MDEPEQCDCYQGRQLGPGWPYCPYCRGTLPSKTKDDPEVGNPDKESKIEYKIKCKFCGDVQILNEKSFKEVLENGCDDECWECMKRGYEPVIPDFNGEIDSMEGNG